VSGEPGACAARCQPTAAVPPQSPRTCHHHFMLPSGLCLPSAGIAIGGDAFPGSTLSDHCLRYQHIPQVKMIVVLGEIGGE
jgi:hypothetical protein